MAIRYVIGNDGKIIAIDDKGRRKLSKLKLYAALKNAGVWAQVKAYLEANDLWDAFLLAQIVDEQNGDFQAGLKTLQESLGLTDDQVEEILSACVADEA